MIAIVAMMPIVAIELLGAIINKIVQGSKVDISKERSIE
jgi:hypothetical protein